MTDERGIMSGMAFHIVFCGIPLKRVSFVDTDQWASLKHHVKGHSRHNSTLIHVGRKNQAKFENDCVSRNRQRIKITQPYSMILVSFSSAEDTLFDDVKRYGTFRLQGTENPPFCSFWDTRYIGFNKRVLLLKYFLPWGRYICLQIIAGMIF